jgi:hypothetical protein
MHPQGSPERRECRRKKRQESQTGVAAAPVDPLDPTQAAARSGTTPAAGEVYTPDKIPARSQADLARAAQTARMTAPEGSYAAGLGEVTGLPMAANNPYLMVNNMFSQEYGLPYGSASSQLAMQHLNPVDKVLGILGEIPGNYIDMVNFGAELIGSSGVGAQLDPTFMIQNIVNGISTADPTQPGAVGTSPFSQIKSALPQDGIEMLIATLSGALVGTMPEDALKNYLTSLEMYAMQFVTGAGGMMNQSLDQFATAEGSGGGWFDQLVATLGPTLGL